MPYTLAYKDTTLDALESVPLKQRQQIVRRIDALQDDPHPRGCKRLHGIEIEGHAAYRIRQGDYRVIYTVDGQTVNILNIGHRKSVYKRH